MQLKTRRATRQPQTGHRPTLTHRRHEQIRTTHLPQLPTNICPYEPMGQSRRTNILLTRLLRTTLTHATLDNHNQLGLRHMSRATRTPAHSQKPNTTQSTRTQSQHLQQPRMHQSTQRTNTTRAIPQSKPNSQRQTIKIRRNKAHKQNNTNNARNPQFFK